MDFSPQLSTEQFYRWKTINVEAALIIDSDPYKSGVQVIMKYKVMEYTSFAQNWDHVFPIRVSHALLSTDISAGKQFFKLTSSTKFYNLSTHQFPLKASGELGLFKVNRL